MSTPDPPAKPSEYATLDEVNEMIRLFRAKIVQSKGDPVLSKFYKASEKIYIKRRNALESEAKEEEKAAAYEEEEEEAEPPRREKPVGRKEPVHKPKARVENDEPPPKGKPRRRESPVPSDSDTEPDTPPPRKHKPKAPEPPKEKTWRERWGVGFTPK